MSKSQIHALLQRAAANGTAIDLTIRRSDAGGVSNSLRDVFVLSVGVSDVRLRRSDGTEMSLALDEIHSLGVENQERRSFLAYLLDLLSLTR